RRRPLTAVRPAAVDQAAAPHPAQRAAQLSALHPADLSPSPGSAGSRALLVRRALVLAARQRPGPGAAALSLSSRRADARPGHGRRRGPAPAPAGRHAIARVLDAAAHRPGGQHRRHARSPRSLDRPGAGGLVTLGADEQRAFARDGYFVRSGLIDDAIVDALL